MAGVAVASHISCAIAFFIVFLILIAHRPTRKQFPLLILSCAMTTIWASLSAFYAAKIIIYLPIIISETIADGCWFFCLIQLLKLTQRIDKSRWYFRSSFQLLIGLFLIGIIVASCFPSFMWEPQKAAAYAKYCFLGYVLFSILLLALVEQIYRGTAPESRWSIKLLCIGTGLIYSYELYMYANAFFINGISFAQWQVRGGIAATIAPLVGLSALHHPKWVAEILPSKAVIFRSTVFISCGIYLALMAGVGYFIRQWGGTWGQPLQIIFFSGSLLVLILMLWSGRARKWTKSFISHNLFKVRFDYRQEWIKFSTLLSSQNDGRQLPTRIIKALADMLESPKGMLFEWEDKRGFALKECWNNDFPNKDVVIEAGLFTEYLQQSQKAIELPARFNVDNRSLVSIPGTLLQFNWAWLLVPLIHGNRLHAFVILAHPRKAFFSLNWEVLDLLSMAGRQAAICLVQEQNAQALAIARQFEGFNRLSAFIVHDLKNVYSQLQMIQINKVKHESNPAFTHTVYQTVDHCADKIDRLLLQMRKKQQSIENQKIDISRVLQKVIQFTNHRQPVPRLEWQLESSEMTVAGEEERFINILCHLVENAQQATSPEGEVILSVLVKDERLIIAIQDTGCGMDPEFVHVSLYRPFVTTKGEKGMGIGVYEAREYMYAVGGRLTVETIKSKGSIFKLEFPVTPIILKQSVA